MKIPPTLLDAEAFCDRNRNWPARPGNDVLHLLLPGDRAKLLLDLQPPDVERNDMVDAFFEVWCVVKTHDREGNFEGSLVDDGLPDDIDTTARVAFSALHVMDVDFRTPDGAEDTGRQGCFVAKSVLTDGTPIRAAMRMPRLNTGWIFFSELVRDPTPRASSQDLVYVPLRELEVVAPEVADFANCWDLRLYERTTNHAACTNKEDRWADITDQLVAEPGD